LGAGHIDDDVALGNIAVSGNPTDKRITGLFGDQRAESSTRTVYGDLGRHQN
jgi:hypothetical protein